MSLDVIIARTTANSLSSFLETTGLFPSIPELPVASRRAAREEVPGWAGVVHAPRE
jgi:hypothetical protein